MHAQLHTTPKPDGIELFITKLYMFKYNHKKEEKTEHTTHTQNDSEAEYFVKDNIAQRY